MGQSETRCVYSYYSDSFASCISNRLTIFSGDKIVLNQCYLEVEKKPGFPAEYSKRIVDVQDPNPRFIEKDGVEYLLANKPYGKKIFVFNMSTLREEKDNSVPERRLPHVTRGRSYNIRTPFRKIFVTDPYMSVFFEEDMQSVRSTNLGYIRSASFTENMLITTRVDNGNLCLSSLRFDKHLAQYEPTYPIVKKIDKQSVWCGAISRDYTKIAYIYFGNDKVHFMSTNKKVCMDGYVELCGHRFKMTEHERALMDLLPFLFIGNLCNFYSI